jgi:hypothetical protein
VAKTFTMFANPFSFVRDMAPDGRDPAPPIAAKSVRNLNAAAKNGIGNYQQKCPGRERKSRGQSAKRTDNAAETHAAEPRHPATAIFPPPRRNIAAASAVLPTTTCRR